MAQLRSRWMRLTHDQHRLRQAILRWIFGIVLASYCIWNPLTAQEKEGEESVVAEWTEADTKLANHYIRLLQEQPEYGNVLDLLWGLYEKKGQTDLLLTYIGNAASAEGADPVAQLIYAHLLRKHNDLDQARDFYGKVLETLPESPIALKASAEIADQQRRDAKAVSLYTRAMAVIPITTEDGVAIRLRKAALHRESEQIDEAVELWNAILESYPGDVKLRTEVVSHLLEAGETESAIRVLKELTGEESQNPEQRLSALMELNKLYEFISDFDGALATAKEALELVHFKNHFHEEFFTRLVRLYERFDRLEELESDLKSKATGERPTEQAVANMAEFYRLTANPESEEIWVQKLAELVPNDLDYQIRLAMIRMENDRYDEAAAVLDQLLVENPQAPLRYTLLRCRVALSDEGRTAAETLLSDYLKTKNPDSAARKEILDFAREFYLDGIVEEMLRGQLGDPTTESAPIKLARFLNERGRRVQAVETLKNYVESAGEAQLDRARRLHEVSIGFRDMGLLKEAAQSIDEAIELVPDSREFHLAKAEISMDRDSIDKALESFDRARELTMGLEEKSELDQRMFSLLRGIVDEEESPEDDPLAPGVIQNVEQMRKVAAALSLRRRESEQPPPQKLVDFYKKIVTQANEEITLETRYRAGWWAFKMQDTQECFNQLTKARAENPTPVVEVEKLLLEMAVQMERPTFQAKHLETLAEIDPENRDDYLQRWAEVRFDLGFEDEAIRTLKELAAKPEASLSTLKTLAKVYRKLNSNKRQIEVWQDAYRRANLFEKRQIIKQLTAALIEQRMPEEALKVQLDLIQRENDPIQKRKQFDTQLTLAQRQFLVPVLQEEYERLSRAKPFDRFYPEALAKIYRAAGNNVKAFDEMKKAYYMSGHDRELLIQLGEMAGNSDDLKGAIYYRRQLIAQGEEDTNIDSWRSLISMLEKDLRVSEADAIRRRLESKFGQDAEFLSEIAEYYRKTGQTTAEVRVLERLVDLRPWDTRSALLLGLAKVQRADFDGAMDAFELVIAHENKAASDELKSGANGELPFLPVTASTGRGVEAMQELIEGIPFIQLELQEGIIEWLDTNHPEFETVPKRPALVRLRAIEEAARITARGSADQLSEWVSRWKRAENATTTEKLWAFHHAGAGRETIEIITPALARSIDRVDHVWFNLLSLQAKQQEVVMDWVKADSTERSAIPVVALFLLVADLPDGKLFPETYDTCIRDLPVSDNIGDRLFVALRQRNDIAGAYRVGKILEQKSLSDSGDFHFQLSELAGLLGYESERISWLDQALELMHEKAIYRLPTYYTTTASELAAAMDSVGAKQEVYDRIESWIEYNRDASEALRLQNRIFLEQLAGNTDAAIEAFGPLWEHTISKYLPTGDVDQDGEVERQRWMQMRLNLKFFAERLQLSPIQNERLNELLSADSTTPAISEEGQSELEDYESERLAFYFERLIPERRMEPLLELDHRIEDRNGLDRLYRTLDSYSFRDESMRMFKMSSRDNPEDYSQLRGFFDAALASKNPEQAIERVNEYLSQGIPVPAGMGIEDIKRYHAEFLFQLRDVERLSQLSQLESTSPLGVSESAAGYQNALGRAYVQTQNHEALIRLLRHLREQDGASKAQLLAGSRLIAQQGNLQLALEWLLDIQLDQTVPATEKEVIRDLATHLTSRDQLADLIREALKHHDPAFTIEIADRLYQAGVTTEGGSALLKQAREYSGPENRSSRFQLLAAYLRFESQYTDAPSSSFDPVLVQLMDNFESSPGNFGTFVDLVVDHGKPDWIPILEPYLTPSSTRTAAKLALWKLGVDGTLGNDFISNLGFRELDLLLEGLAKMGDVGQKEAVSILARRPDHTTRPSFNGDAARQIAFYAAVNDPLRLAEVYARLMEETESDRFFQRAQSSEIANFATRWHLAAQFEAVGETEKAASLYRTYFASIRRFSSQHTPFLEEYARFAAKQGDLPLAEEILRPGFQKALRLSPAILAEVHHMVSGKVPEVESLAVKFHLSKGEMIELEEARRQLAETGKLPDTSIRL